jgi:hypothetical protein
MAAHNYFVPHLALKNPENDPNGVDLLESKIQTTVLQNKVSIPIYSFSCRCMALT